MKISLERALNPYIHAPSICIYTQMDETVLWVMGLGPVLVHKQFVKDIGRRKVDWYVNGIPLPRDAREALQILYDECGHNYYTVSKYMNQTLGNMMYMHATRKYKKHLPVTPHTYSLSLAGHELYGRLLLEGVLCECLYNIDKGTCLLRAVPSRHLP